MKINKNVQGNSDRDVIYEKDLIYVHTNIEQDKEYENIFNYDEYVFEYSEDPVDLIAAQDKVTADLMDEIEDLCNEIIGE